MVKEELVFKIHTFVFCCWFVLSTESKLMLSLLSSYVINVIRCIITYVKYVFLNGDLKEVVFVKQPEGFIVPEK